VVRDDGGLRQRRHLPQGKSLTEVEGEFRVYAV